MIDLYDEQALVFDLWDQAYEVNPLAWRKLIEDWLGSLGEEEVKVDFKRVAIHQSGALGFASALIHVQAISPEGAILRRMKNRLTLVLTKSEYGWTVIHQHISYESANTKLTFVISQLLNVDVT